MTERSSLANGVSCAKFSATDRAIARREMLAAIDDESPSSRDVGAESADAGEP